jgi:2-keto-4-pentenoate hydratase
MMRMAVQLVNVNRLLSQGAIISGKKIGLTSPRHAAVARRERTRLRALIQIHGRARSISVQTS